MFKGLHRNPNYETDKIIHLSKDEDGQRQINQDIQQESDLHNDGPLIIDIGHYDDHILDNIRHHKEHIPTIGIGDEHPQKELIDTLQNIIEQEGQRGIIILGGKNPEEGRLSDFVEHIMEETRQEIFQIENMLDHEVYIETKIQEMSTSGHKYAKHHHKFHNQKPSGRKGNHQHNRRK